ncbi:MAG TPA: LLM class flavin-dependent oxidoreductase [Jatrophihabitans sp.]|nr:LLM class flavin-dependent oxidoreductase [Jatrophihabitans sp.]
MNQPLGVQIAPWTSAREVYESASLLGKAFEVVWVPDQLLARNAYVLLAALAASGRVGVASGVAVPLGRNPVELASAMATIAELVPVDRPVLMGMGAGGPLVSSMFVKRGATDLLGEAIGLIRRLWAGEQVTLGDYPMITSRLCWRADATARLGYPVPRNIPIVLAVGGPRTLRLVEDAADGLLCTSTFPRLSYAALAAGSDGITTIRELVARRAQVDRPLRLVYGLNCCVSANRGHARAFARRQVALILGNPALRAELAAAGLDPAATAAVRAAFTSGGGLDEAAQRLPEEVVDAFVVAGEPQECAERLTNTVAIARRAGFTDFYLGAPLGPDLHEAARLLVDVVVPQVWPAA